MLKKKAMIYPVDREAIPTLRYNCLLEEYDIVYAVSPKGWGLTGKDCGVLDGGHNMGKIITKDFDKALNSCECVIFMESDMMADFEKIILPKMEKAIEASKDIVCTIEIPDKFKEEIYNRCQNKEIKLKYYEKKKEFKLNPIEKEYTFDIGVPVMGVFGTTERTGKFNMQLAIREKLINQGYKVSQIGTKHYSEMFGFHSFPEFMMNSSISESNKVMLFNHYIKRIEVEENPDIILIGVPGGTMSYNNKYTNRFGILAFEVCSAVQFDSAIVNTLYNDYKEDYFASMNQALRYRLGIEIDAFNVAPVKGDFEILDSRNRFGYLTLSSEFIDDKIKKFSNLNLKVCNVLNDENRENVVDYLINKLASYSEVEAI